MAIIELATGNVLGLGQFFTAPATGNQLVVNAISFVDAVSVHKREQIVGSVLTFSQSVHVSPIILNVVQTLGLSQAGQKTPLDRSVESVLSFVDSAKTNITPDVESVLVLVDQVEVVRGMSNKLNLAQTLQLNIVSHQVVTHSLVLTAAASIFKANDPSFIGIVVPDAVPQKLSMTCGSLSIELDYPLFGDSDEIEHLRINQNSRGGDHIIFRDVMWPKVERLSYSFDNLMESKAKSLLDFVHATVGKAIVLTDYNGIVWNVIITNPQAEVSQKGRCSFATGLEFEGTRA